jgi:HAE1 family hydrophobic/amphiphilic exporter-1
MSIAEKNERGGTLAALFVRRPVLAVVINAMIVVAGLAALLGAEVRELPSVEQPVLTISTSFTGAAAETVDREITAVVEGAVARVQGVTGISSSSSTGQSRVTLEFSDSTNLDVATSDVRDALSRIGRSLPDNVDDPVIFKADSDAQPVMQLAVTSDAMSMGDLSKLVEDTISERLGAVAGVAEVQVYGTRDTAFDVDVDPIKLASHGLTVADVRTALATIALDTPTGSINGPNQNITVRAISEVTTPQDFEDIVIKGRTLLGDVASVVFDASASTSSLRSNGKPGIGLGIVRQAQSNTIEISQGIHNAVEVLNQTLPAGVQVTISSDDAVFIEGALHEVEVALIVALVVVVAIIFLFLLDWRATIVPAISMPIALLGAVAGIYVMGFSLNIITLLALVLATGLVVDDAIVVLENIVRRKGMGAGPRAAAVLGTQEVFFAVIATTLTLAAVFIPLSFLSGQTGRLFREFGFTLAIAVLLSSIVALSMGPMIASRFLKQGEHKSHGGLRALLSWLAPCGAGQSLCRGADRPAVRRLVLFRLWQSAPGNHPARGPLADPIAHSGPQHGQPRLYPHPAHHCRNHAAALRRQRRGALHFRALRLGQRRFADPDAGPLVRAHPQPAADRHRHHRAHGSGARRARLGGSGQ